ncbi:unnamed protein product [Macrosiphum euphorbiae]|uniref:Uncharacterized protein n=1 Tax=Macrosiphum euphorbiae TaxID=13131 RepID=A0AAV0VGV3_9HEMI|nr:unnamed protein product [Macrosiphum euphorbiae]
MAALHASAKTESHVPNDLVDQIPGSTFRQLVANCVKDLARTACVPELPFACAQNLPAQDSAVEIVHLVTFIENVPDVPRLVKRLSPESKSTSRCHQQK